MLLETAPGHAIRCIPTPYADTFEAEKRRLTAEGKSPRDVTIALERMNLGRLRVASKGVDRPAAGEWKLVELPEDDVLGKNVLERALPVVDKPRDVEGVTTGLDAGGIGALQHP